MDAVKTIEPLDYQERAVQIDVEDLLPPIDVIVDGQLTAGDASEAHKQVQSAKPMGYLFDIQIHSFLIGDIESSKDYHWLSSIVFVRLADMIKCFLPLLLVDVEDGQAGNAVLKHGPGTHETQSLSSTSHFHGQSRMSSTGQGAYL
ncbi:MAG: hypothetical protein LQ346_008196 [Caloplaca aetnensis]|nr:MAG: hypothetical protein LQ346_008196 [Caloplaca aetnensis]